jgi:hypothetical protein
MEHSIFWMQHFVFPFVEFASAVFFIKIENLVNHSHRTLRNYSFFIYSRTLLIRSKWGGEPSGYAENPDNWIFLLK